MTIHAMTDGLSRKNCFLCGPHSGLVLARARNCNLQPSKEMEKNSTIFPFFLLTATQQKSS